MNAYIQELRATAKAMVTEGKGILAMDESNGTCISDWLKEVRMPIVYSTETLWSGYAMVLHI